MPDAAATRRKVAGRLRDRMNARDGGRRLLCRRSLAAEDVILHGHHVIPWEIGGPTDLENVVSLCERCHKGLVPHFQPRLRRLAGLPGPETRAGIRSRELAEDIARYREIRSRRTVPAGTRRGGPPPDRPSPPPPTPARKPG